MKHALTAAAVMILLVAGCHAAQVPATPPAYQCPAVVYPGGTAYTPVNQPANDTSPANITGSSYTWSPPSVGAWCAILQVWALPAGGTIYQVSDPSNPVEVTTTTALPKIDYTWTAPAPNSTYATYTYVLSYAPAIQAPLPTAPSLTSGTAGTN